MHPPMSGIWRRRLKLGFSPVNKEVGHHLRLDGGARLVADVVVGHGDGPLGNPARGITVANDFLKWSRAHHRNGVLLEVFLQLLMAKYAPYHIFW